MAVIDKTYRQLLEKITTDGYAYEDPNRKGVNRIEIPSYTFRHEFKYGFPAISTKKLHYKNVVTELIWFLRGDTNIKYLVDNGCNIWNKDAYKHYKGELTYNEWLYEIQNNPNNELGDLGPVYGKQWRKQVSLKGKTGIGKQIITDQISNLIKSLKNKPLGTEHIVNSWNAAAISDMALPPCHYGFQIVVRLLSNLEINMMKQQVIIDVYHKDKSKCLQPYLEEEYKLLPKYGFELHWNQRSVDTFLGLPYNIASYATLALILEKITGYKALAIQGDLKKVHLYDNSLDAVKEQLNRDADKYSNTELTFHGESGTTMFDHFNDIYRPDIDLNMLINTFTPGTFKLMKYESYPAINVEMLERNE